MHAFPRAAARVGVGSRTLLTSPDFAAHFRSSALRRFASRFRRAGDFSIPLVDVPCLPRFVPATASLLVGYRFRWGNPSHRNPSSIVGALRCQGRDTGCAGNLRTRSLDTALRPELRKVSRPPLMPEIAHKRAKRPPATRQGGTPPAGSLSRVSLATNPYVRMSRHLSQLSFTFSGPHWTGGQRPTVWGTNTGSEARRQGAAQRPTEGSLSLTVREPVLGGPRNATPHRGSFFQEKTPRVFCGAPLLRPLPETPHPVLVSGLRRARPSLVARVRGAAFAGSSTTPLGVRISLFAEGPSRCPLFIEGFRRLRGGDQNPL